MHDAVQLCVWYILGWACLGILRTYGEWITGVSWQNLLQCSAKTVADVCMQFMEVFWTTVDMSMKDGRLVACTNAHDFTLWAAP